MGRTAGIGAHRWLPFARDVSAVARLPEGRRTDLPRRRKLEAGDGGTGKHAVGSHLQRAVCGSGEAGRADATIAWFAEKGVPHIAITRGAKPIVGYERGRRFEIEIAKIEAVDTTGAGDVLHGAFCYHFAKTGEFETALRLAAEIATDRAGSGDSGMDG